MHFGTVIKFYKMYSLKYFDKTLINRRSQGKQLLFCKKVFTILS